MDYSGRFPFNRKACGVYYLARRTFPKHKILDAVDPEDFAVDPTVRENYLKDPLVHPYINPMTAIDRLADAAEILEKANAKGKPVYLMHGSDDRICSPKGSRRFAKKRRASCVRIRKSRDFATKL